MSPKEMTTFRFDSDLLDAMRKVKDEEGIPVTTQVEFAVRDWLERRGALPKKKKRT